MDEIKCEHEEVCGCCDVDHEECEYFAPKVDIDLIRVAVGNLETIAEAFNDAHQFSAFSLVKTEVDRIREALGEDM